MGFERIKYNKGQGILKIKVEDQTGALIENWTIMMSDLIKWTDLMIRKYGLNSKSIDRDLDWIR